MLKKFIVIFLLIQFCVALNLRAIDKVAEVANESITWLELQKRYEKLWKDYQEDKSKFPRLPKKGYQSQLQKLALDKLIEEKLFEIYAKENGISISQQEVDAIFREIYAGQAYFQTEGSFDKKKYEKFKENYPQRYDKIVSEIKKDFSFEKIKQIIEEKFKVNDQELYRRYVRDNSEIKLRYVVVPDSLMPSYFPSTPFYLKEYYIKNRNDFQELREVKISFVFIDDKDFLPQADSYQEFMEKYKNDAHKKAHDYAERYIKNLELSHNIIHTQRHLFTTEFLRQGEKIGNLKNSENIIRLALKLDKGEIFEYPIETEKGWIVFQAEEFRTISSDNLQNIALNVWRDYIEKGKELYYNNLVKDYYKKNIKGKDVFKINFSYLQIPIKSLDFDLSFEEDTTTVKEYYEKNIEEYVTVRDTLALEKIREDVIEDLMEDTTKALTDSLLDTLMIQLEKKEILIWLNFHLS